MMTKGEFTIDMIETLINADEVEQEKLMRRDYEMMQFYFKHPHITKLVDWFMEHYSELAYALICKRFGHKIIDNGSYAGPESGADHLMCIRCGQHFDHIYY